MTTTVQDILDRALERSTANESALFSGGNVEILTRVDRSQQRLFTRLADENRYFYMHSGTAASSDAASARVIDLSVLSPAVERLLYLELPTGEQVNAVDIQDLTAELAPRFYPKGSTLVEVGQDWGASGIVTLNIWYAYRPAPLVLAGALSQSVTVPDRFCDYLELDLAIYLAGKDFGRTESAQSEVSRLTAEQGAVYQDYLGFLGHFAGPGARRFVLPVPVPGEKA